ncbi:Cyanidin 3-O-glucoside 7-O-glucosyltransferase (acyl-glucose) [Frankliniella fusca]|uniref:Cyanidin 3-O-glucoside 7-O-glucosyltransferase (Acyl-glucose) n=1 Tax=Frankliniella fusca TaxID=407009 RepID=A0AAE1HQ86_9NEOP|nr:Cyanidin 3-O-glucoside 7-O-glucosyltransferase (acyl-glucose) [Frankliniella fusca]
MPCPGNVPATDEEDYTLPSGLLIGAGVSALQTEGAWDEEGKAESAADWVMDVLNWSGRKVAADSYHRYKDDVKKAAELKLSLYKFSISWARVLPTADASAPNEKGVAFYNNLIDAIIENGMKPMVTMYHFDHPKVLEDQFKGWQDSKMAEKFAEYAGFLFKTFGDRVEHWITINEPNMYCAYFNELFIAAKFRKPEEVDPYTCIHNNVLAHMKAKQIFKKQGLKGKIGYSTLLMYAKPATTSPEDIYAASAFNELHAGSSLHPVVYGDYPQVYKNIVGEKRLLKFTEDEKAELVGSADFIGLNIYFGAEASFNRFNNATGGGMTDKFLGQMSQDISFVDVSIAAKGGAAAVFTTIDPDVMRNALLWTHENYKIPIVITENGYGDVLGLGVHDKQRAAYHSAFLRMLVTTVKNYDVSVIAYSAWSLIDSFEFSAGFGRPFGLVHVDYEHGTLDRSLKDSSQFWIDLKEKGYVPYINPDGDSTTISPGDSTTISPVPSSSEPTVSKITFVFIAMLPIFSGF